MKSEWLIWQHWRNKRCTCVAAGVDILPPALFSRTSFEFRTSFLFLRLKHALKGKGFDDIPDIQRNGTRLLNSIPKEGFLQSFQDMHSRSQWCIVKGDQQKDGPTIDGGKHVYSVGDLVDINCTAARSQPPAELHWYINDKEVRPDYLVPRKPIVYHNGEESPVLGLKFIVKQRHFQKQEMRLRCTATLSEVKRMTSEPLEAILAEQQKSDLHVDLNISSVSNRSTWGALVIHPLCCLFIFLVSRTFF
ncbi:c2-set_2 domain-containing protein [Trichonephila clavipes]|uniref:C2-set_2 domain-containing protein n=1 Tax=Trichonephila clavipes TaxID=2585209 RepID=A0A8X6RC20_TRICX|nr:c2-set_2 domain-containing protein [Trichonephila clavipes]